MTTWMTIEHHGQLPVLTFAPMTDTRHRPLQRTQFMAQAIGDGEQVGQPMHRCRLRARVDQQTDFQRLGTLGHCQFFPPICRSSQSARAPLKPITITTPQSLPAKRLLK
ncbi:hypothetical protein [Pseudomonas sp.]|uniref:hypothetical protein n=1 Tax=Pseudomonas sp. TaxID=306 RepID=UPI003D6DE58F